MPVGWASPAFDVLQLEDYDWVTQGRERLTARGVELAVERLGYPVEAQHYLSGFVLRGEDAAQWREIAAAADAAMRRGTAATFIRSEERRGGEGGVSTGRTWGAPENYKKKRK